MTDVPIAVSTSSAEPRNRRRVVVAVLVATLVAAACGSDSDTQSETGGVDSSDATGAEPIEAGENESVPPDEAPQTSAPTAPATDVEAFPVEITHRFGTTLIESEPERIVSIGYNQHDFLLALGVVPVGLREWYGDQPNGVWPWAQDELGVATPEVISGSELNFEQIAALRPDMINALWSGITEEDYQLLTAIAPTVAEPMAYQDYGTPWQEQTEILGQATGRPDVAGQIVSDVEGLLEAARYAHPDWSELSAAVAFVTEDGPGVYSTEDIRSRFLTDLGFSIPGAYDEGGEFFLPLSPEDLSPIDVDLIVWVAGSQEGLEAIVEQLPTRSSLDVVKEGREVFASVELGGAFSHSSPLSIEFVIEELVPEIGLAVDGDPSTVVPSAAAIGAVDATETAPATREFVDQADEEAAAAWATVFDSRAEFAEKAPHLEDADALAATVDAYREAGDGFGGISLVPTSTQVDGDTATITYDVNFGGTAAYSDQIGTVTLVDGQWVVGRDEFCSFMASARVGCDE